MLNKSFTNHLFIRILKQVLESQGHIRDLAAKSGSVDTADNFKMTWSIEDRAQVRLDRIKQELQRDGIMRLVLATDPDREGEAIAWHLQDMLQVRSLLFCKSVFPTITGVCKLSFAHFPRLSMLCPFPQLPHRETLNCR